MRYAIAAFFVSLFAAPGVNDGAARARAVMAMQQQPAAVVLCKCGCRDGQPCKCSYCEQRTGSPCACGCKDTGQCQCKNCNEHTADPAYKKPASVKWRYRYERPEGQPLLVVVQQENCPPCKVLDTTLASMDTDLHGFACVKIDRLDPIAASLGVTVAPTIIVSGADGCWRSTTPGAISADAIRVELAKAGKPAPVFMPVSAPVFVPRQTFRASCGH